MFAVAVPFAAIVWLFAAPLALSAVTFVAVALLAAGAALVALNTWRNGQATRTIGHVLNDAEAAGRADGGPQAQALVAEKQSLR